MDRTPLCLLQIGPFQCLCRNTNWANADGYTELNFDDVVQAVPVGPTLLTSPRSRQPAYASKDQKMSSRTSATQEEEPECEADAGEASPISEISRFYSVTSQEWSFAGSPSAGDSSKTIDLSGDWVLDRVEGRMEELMTESGIPWSVRKMATAASYGAGLARQVIIQDGPRISIEFRNLQSYTTEVESGKAKQETLAEDGTAVIASARWEGSSFWIDETNQTTGATMHSSRRYIEDGEMVQETLALAGFRVKRFFRKAA